jgi:hypothetical protein
VTSRVDGERAVAECLLSGVVFKVNNSAIHAYDASGLPLASLFETRARHEVTVARSDIPSVVTSEVLRDALIEKWSQGHDERER